MNNIVVFSIVGHESGATILKDGDVYEIILEERLSRIKKDTVLHYVFEPVKKFHKLHGIDQIYFVNGEKDEQEHLLNCLKKYNLQDIPVKFETQSHHVYHAASGFYASGFDEAVCIVIDAIGAGYGFEELADLANIELGDEEKESLSEWSNLEFSENVTIYEVKYPNRFNILWKNLLTFAPGYIINKDFPDDFFKMMVNCEKIDVNSSYDIGIMYEAISYHLGFGQENSGKTMGLSAYGSYNKELPRLMMDNGMANMNVFYSDRFLNITNHPELKHFNEFQKKADIAWSIQKAMENVLRIRVKQALKLKPHTKNIVFSGGCAMNICANTIICEEFPDINFFVDPIPGDAGQSLGAAQYFHYEGTQSMEKRRLTTTYHGPHQEITRSQVEHEVAKINNVNYN